jgi:FKBP-type peptidyl-prolyl cis-trans isomerase FkpA
MKHFLRPTLTAAALAVALGITAGAQAQTSSSAASAPVANRAQASQILGYQMVGSIPGVIRQNVDPAVVGQAVTAALSGQKPNISDAQAQTVWKQFMTEMQAKAKAEFDAESAKNKAAGDAFLAKNKSVSGVKVTASGLQYQVLASGTGARPGPNDTVKINYTGTFVDGKVFDSSANNGGPVSIPLAHVIPGFREGLQLMQVGGHYKLFIPPGLAYGAEPSRFPEPNATLVFDITLISTGPTAASPQEGAGAPGGGAPDGSGGGGEQ